MTMLQEFKRFLLRGNVIDLAVGVVVGASFKSIVDALVADFLTPFISAFTIVPDFSEWIFRVRGSEFLIGHFLNAVISFVLVAASVFFLIVKPVNALVARSRRDQSSSNPTTARCPECLSEIPIAAKRCAYCGQTVTDLGR